jgi:hypothetical protein
LYAAAQLLLALASVALPEARSAERDLLGVVVFTPGPILANVGAQDVIRALASDLEPHTRFRAGGFDPGIMTECGGKLACMADKVRAEHPRLLLVVSSLAKKHGARLSVTLLDVDLALHEHDIADKQRPDWEQGLEALVNERAVLFGPAFIELESGAPFEPAIARFVDESLRPPLAARGEWDPFGEIVVTAPAGAEVEIDGRPAGTTKEGPLAIDRVLAGRHTVQVRHRAYLPYETPVDVPRLDRTSVDAVLIPRPAEGAAELRRAVLWSGVGLMAVGTVLASVAVFRQNGDVEVYCFAGGTPPSSCAGSRQFQTAGYSSGVAPSFKNDLNPGGVLVLPLGYSVFLTGATWSLGTLVFGSDGDVPWVQLAAGVVAGVLAYGLSAAVNGHTAF